MWSAGLYSEDYNNYGAVVKSGVSALARVPEDGDTLLELFCEANAEVALNPQDERHYIFWLATADQFARKGIVSERARSTALRILDEELELERCRQLGLKEALLKKRAAVLAEVRQTVLATSEKKRPTLKKPQPLVMHVGDVLTYPVGVRGRCPNPYYPAGQDPDFQSTQGWRGLLVLETGHLFGYLAWYRAACLAARLANKPSREDLLAHGPWALAAPGPCSPTQFERMLLEKVGEVKVRPTWRALPHGSAYWTVIKDICICNEMGNRQGDAHVDLGSVLQG